MNTLIFLTSIPVGYFLAWLTKEELEPGRKWFKLFIYILVIIIAVALLFYRDLPIMLSLGYMVVITLVSLYRGGKQ